jgi:hypothetical protein
MPMVSTRTATPVMPVLSAAVLRAAVLGAGVLGVGVLGGCATDPEPVGSLQGNSLTATYAMGTLSTTVDKSTVGTREVAAAAENVLRRRGYTIRSASISDDLTRISGSAVGAGNWDATIVSASRTATGVRIEVHVEPFGDQDKSRAVLNDVLGRLGL